MNKIGIVNSVRVDDWTAESAINASDELFNTVGHEIYLHNNAIIVQLKKLRSF